MADSPDAVLEVYRAARAQRASLARQDAGTFVEYVMRDEATGQPVRLAPMHEEWHQLANAHPRLVIRAHVEAGKSFGLTVGRTLWELGRNPSLRAAIVSNTHGQASKLLRVIASYIERSPEVREVFPGLLPGTPWTDGAIAVQRPTLSKDPSLQAFGVHGAVIGSRLDLLILDDVVDFENARTPEQRETLIAWMLSTLMGRLSATGRVIVVGTAFHPEDLLHRLEDQGWPSYRFPVEYEDGTPRWPHRWTRQRIAEKRMELGPAEAARQLDVAARSDAESRFKEAWLATALQRGTGKTCLPHLLHVPNGTHVVHGVDLAVSKRANADLSVIVSLLVLANGDRQLLSVQSGRWSGPEIVHRIMDAHRRYGGIVVVESVAAQAFISHFLRELSAIPVIDFKTGRNKMSLEWQTEALAAEFSRGQWIVPSDNGSAANNPEAATLLRDLLFYDPRRHTPDRVAAACFARWGADRSRVRAEVGRLDLMSR
jgi:hypothetical protein